MNRRLLVIVVVIGLVILSLIFGACVFPFLPAPWSEYSVIYGDSFDYKVTDIITETNVIVVDTLPEGYAGPEDFAFDFERGIGCTGTETEAEGENGVLWCYQGGERYKIEDNEFSRLTGMAFLPGERIVAADFLTGTLLIDISEGLSVKPRVSHLDYEVGVDGIAVSPDGKKVFVTDGIEVQMEWNGALGSQPLVMEGFFQLRMNSGSVSSIDLETGVKKPLIGELYFPAGLAVGSSGDKLLVPEMWKCGLREFDPSTSTFDRVLIEDSPFQIDGVSVGPNGEIVVAFVEPREGFFEFLQVRPTLRALLWPAFMDVIMSMDQEQAASGFLILSEEGNLIAFYRDTDGSVADHISSAYLITADDYRRIFDPDYKGTGWIVILGTVSKVDGNKIKAIAIENLVPELD